MFSFFKNSTVFHGIFYKFKHMRYSMTYIGIFFFAIIVIAASLILPTIPAYYNRQLRTQYYDNMNLVLSYFNQETANSFSTLESYLFQLGYYDTDISVLNTTQDTQKFYHAKMSVYKMMQNDMRLFPFLGGMFVYSPSADDYTPYINAASSLACSEYIHTFLSENRASFYHIDNLYNRWHLYQAGTDYYLIRYILSGNTILGAWTSLDMLSTSITDVFDEGALICFMDENHRLLQDDLFSDYRYKENTVVPYQLYKDKKENQQYLVVCQPVSYSDCSIALFLPLDHLSGYISSVFRQFIVIAALIFLALIGISILMKCFIDIPIQSMHRVLDTLQNEKEDLYLPETDTHCLEIQQLYQTLNTLIQQIRHLRIDIYEEKIAKSKLELQFLKSQISPHFLVNCLTTFSFLASSSDDNEDNAFLADRLVETLSQHIRYSFCSKALIPLSQEFDHMDAYLELSGIRYPDSLVYRLSLPADCKDCMIPPMLLLTLCENTIKHNLIMGKHLQIIVTVTKTDNDPNTQKQGCFHITYIDSGSGYPDEILKLNNHILEHPEITSDGYHIGIYNIAKTLDLQYHSFASILFSNEPKMGARVDITIPLPPTDTTNTNTKEV